MVEKSLILECFVRLGRIMLAVGRNQTEMLVTEELVAYKNLNSLVETESNFNPWFTERFCRMSMCAIGEMLDYHKVAKWLEGYKINGKPHTIAVVAAGNIPMVAMHDILCIIASGNHALVKLSSKDKRLIPACIEIIESFSNEFIGCVTYTEHILKGFDAIIATGSDNSSSYFEYYFSKYPHIIRKNRSSVAILTGNETSHDLNGLAIDVFSYFGLGCRNVSKLYLPQGYDVCSLYSYFEAYKEVCQHHKYMNNVEYMKAIYLVEKIDHFDNGFLLMKNDGALSSPIGVLYYDYFTDINALNNSLAGVESKIQCVVGLPDTKATVLPGRSQYPEIAEYADNIDTMDFLTSLNN